MKPYLFLCLAFILLVSCTQFEQGSIAYRVTENDLIPEGVTYSQKTNSFYIGSILKKKIIQIDAETGEFKDFTPSLNLEKRFLGLDVDNERNHLWAVGFLEVDNYFTNAVFKFDLEKSELIKTYTFDYHQNEPKYNDLVVDNEGTVYFTNRWGSTICKIDPQSDTISEIYYSKDIFHPNGITISDDQKKLYIASQTDGIRVFDIESKKLLNEVNYQFDTKGVDGMKYYNNRIVAIQNHSSETPETRIVAYVLDESGNKIIGEEVIDVNNPKFAHPTTHVIVGDELFCMASSQLDRLNYPKYELIDPNIMEDILILKYKLK